ncbi:MAG: hypothetical protein B6I34_00870 [Anaerolineaceae bacterium 4572_32.1]|nr:MAG: hypothetical protein B6I34_00870 [Anaerolineaceae bacterium 4572_32.1]
MSKSAKQQTSNSARRPTCKLANLTFSQHNLQNYADCPRRFQLRHLLGVVWPAEKAKQVDEWEKRARLGRRFHHLAQQHALGIPAERLETGIDDDDLRRWWHNFSAAPPRDLPTGLRRAEVSLSAPLEGYRLTARYDLLAADPGQRLVVVDWKIKQPPKNQYMLKKLQSIVYPYVLVKAGALFNGGQPVEPEQVTLIYWFADAPDDPLILAYDAARHAANDERLTTLIREIEARCEENNDAWPRTNETRICKYCRYRSLCNRGSTAGDLGALDQDPELEEDFDIDINQIAEIAF